ncbi:MAG: cbb3-type cytochrome c oxidase subunit I [Planctomycetes bacterium]|nr:cbb3-type cytochrome c oxidase subunit I [Planctomycetota bacterium]
MSTTAPAPAHADHAAAGHGHHELPFLRKWVFSTDHKVIGLQYLFCCLFTLMVGGLLALMVRWQIAYPAGAKPTEEQVQELRSRGLTGAELDAELAKIDNDRPFPILGELLWGEHLEPELVNAGEVGEAGVFGNSNGMMPAEWYNVAFTMHASVMIFLVIIPMLTGAFGNWVIPLQLGAKDMAFPFLNGLSFWTWICAVLILFASFFVDPAGIGAGAGWTSYPPLSDVVTPTAGPGQTLWCIGVIIGGTSSIMGSMNYITTIVNLRAPGLSLFRMPLTTWAAFITSILQLFATPVLSSAMAMLLFDRHMGTSFFLPEGLIFTGETVPNAGGGQVILWQHIFWFYSHPAVYIMILPAMGIVSDVIAVWSRKPIFGYRPMVYSMSAIAGLGFVVWGHHMFQSGMNPVLGTTFMISTIMIALPSAVKVFNWLGTLWGGQITFSPAMLFALGFVSMFVIGGLSGIYMANAPFDIFIHDTYFIVAHIHYVLFTGSVMGIFSGIYHWFPKMFARHMNDAWGKVHFWLTFIFMNGVFFPMHIIGLGGYPRRYASFRGYDFLAPYEGMNVFMTWCAILLGLSQFIFLANFFGSLLFGKKATSDNPWHANSLEWSTQTPPPHGNWIGPVPTVYHGPYEYSNPNCKEDYAPQWMPMQTIYGGSTAAAPAAPIVATGGTPPPPHPAH